MTIDEIDFDNLDDSNPFAARLLKAHDRASAIERKQEAFSRNSIPGTYITGNSGIPASRRRKLDKQLDRTIDLAVASVKAMEKAGVLAKKYVAYADGRCDAQGRSIRPHSPKQKKPKMTAREALFSGVYPGGIVYADRAVSQGDYKRCAFLNFSTLELTIKDDCPARLIPLIKEDAGVIQAMDGQRYPTSSSGNSCVLLGSGKNMSAAEKRLQEWLDLPTSAERRAATDAYHRKRKQKLAAMEK